MSDPTSVIKELERLADTSVNDAHTIRMLIGQLQRAGQGKVWCNPDVAMAEYYVRRAGGRLDFEQRAGVPISRTNDPASTR